MPNAAFASAVGGETTFCFEFPFGLEMSQSTCWHFVYRRKYHRWRQRQGSCEHNRCLPDEVHEQIALSYTSCEPRTAHLAESSSDRIECSNPRKRMLMPAFLATWTICGFVTSLLTNASRDCTLAGSTSLRKPEELRLSPPFRSVLEARRPVSVFMGQS